MDIPRLRKAELHCHLDGIVDPAILRELLVRGHKPGLALEDLAAATPVRSFEAFVRWFGVTKPLEGLVDNFLPILDLHIQRLIAQNVVYTEIMIGSSEIPRDTGRLIDQFSEFRKAVNWLERGKIQVEFLVALGRGVPVERFDELADRIILLRKANMLFGVALAGWPETPIRPLSRVLARLHDAGLGIEIHAGDWAGPESVWDALEYGFPDRSGHGVALFQDPWLVERFQKDQVHIEMCPVSNLKTGSVLSIQDHPVHLARDRGLNYSINTDDPGPFENSMNAEYQLLLDTFGFTEADFAKIFKNTLAARFQPQLRILLEEAI